MDEGLINWLIVIATGIIAYHGLTFRDKKGEKDGVRLLFGCIALLYCVTILFNEILDIW